MTENGWSLAAVVAAGAERSPGAIAISAAGGSCSWAELERSAARVAAGLRAAGVGPGHRVAYIDRNGAEYFEALFGAGKLGAVTVAVNWRLAPREIEYIIGDCGATVVFVGTEFAAAVAEMRPRLKNVRLVVGLGAGVGEVAYGDWKAAHAPLEGAEAGAPQDVALQLYTSGTTGLPKGAMLTNANLGGMIHNITPSWGLGPESVSGVIMPLFHIGGSGWALAGMTAGCRSVVIRDPAPPVVLEALEQGITHTFVVPALLQALSAVPGAAGRDYTRLRTIFYGASPITDQALVTAMETFGCDLVQLYGLTETTGAITQLDAADHDPGGPRSPLLRSAGRPYPWVELVVADPETGRPRPAGEVGEVWTRSAQNMKGYWNQPDATAAVLRPDGWLRTGDAGYLDGDGFLFLTDRIKDMIVSGGENVYPAEVENVVAAHPAVADVAVIGVPDERWGETVKAVVVLRAGMEPDPAGIIAFTRERLAHFKCPTSVDFLECLPRNPSGKILKRELRAPYWEGRNRQVN